MLTLATTFSKLSFSYNIASKSINVYEFHFILFQGALCRSCIHLTIACSSHSVSGFLFLSTRKFPSTCYTRDKFTTIQESFLLFINIVHYAFVLFRLPQFPSHPQYHSPALPSLLNRPFSISTILLSPLLISTALPHYSLALQIPHAYPVPIQNHLHTVDAAVLALREDRRLC